MKASLLSTKDRGCWVDDDQDNINNIRVIVQLRYFNKLFIKTSNDVLDETLELVKNSNAANLELWLPNMTDVAPFDTVYSIENEDYYLFMKTLSRNNRPKVLNEVYEQAIGGSWDGQLKETMMALSMNRVSMPPKENDYLIQEDFSSLPTVHGWRAIEWRAESKEFDLGGKVGKQILVCDTVVWQIDIQGVIVQVSSEMGWKPYRHND